MSWKALAVVQFIITLLLGAALMAQFISVKTAGPVVREPAAPGESTLAYTPPPIMVHIDPFPSFLTEQVIGAIHGAGAKVYANAFLMADVEALTAGRFEAYAEMFDAGLDVVQTEFPHWALTGLDRLDPAQ